MEKQSPDKTRKTVCITGAGKGIGFQLVQAFLADPQYQVIATSRNVHELEKIRHPHLVVIQGDLLADYTSIQTKILAATSSVDILINNAALVLNKPMLEVVEEDIQAVMGTNFSAPYRLIRDLEPRFGKGTHIINISSMSGFQGSKKFTGLTLYSASKAALASLSECVAEEWREKEIYCNCLALGAVDTDMIKVSIPGLKPVVTAKEMAAYIYDFALKGHRYYNGQVLPVSLSTL